MKNTLNVVERNKKNVRAFYEIGIDASFFHRDFIITAPDYLPWGGTAKGADAYLGNVVVQAKKALDFSRLTIESIVAEDDNVVLLIHVGVAGTDAMIRISEHWVVVNDKALSLWVAYFEPKALMDQLIKTNVS